MSLMYPHQDICKNHVMSRRVILNQQTKILCPSNSNEFNFYIIFFSVFVSELRFKDHRKPRSTLDFSINTINSIIHTLNAFISQSSN